MFKSITHVIYDMDGLLLDTESLNEQVNSEIVQRYGKSFDAKLKIAIAGRTTIDSARIIIDTLSIPLTVEEYIVERNKLLYPLYSTAQALPGTRELIQHLAKHKIPQAIASSSTRKHFEMKMVNHQQWSNMIQVMTLGDDPELKRGKPAPDIFLLTAQRLNADPRQCLVFEDSLAGMKAAIAAEMSVVIIPDPVFDKQPFQDATQVLNSMTEFNPQAWNLPGMS
ncbi:HAD-IA family hydrolase [Pleurocapsa sp. PCC 7319]|uniref:HAD-IA family hydrolase n=1 Tax=Pleurocapsa sp. PCC 7319 TaxID=118161 RepID=UPI00034BA390|nr:HAD-IA family hydrolase [Pleurocapsa sp. PCC 7319]